MSNVMKKIFICFLSFSLILPSFSASVYASEMPQEVDISLLEEDEENQVELVEEELEGSEEKILDINEELLLEGY